MVEKLRRQSTARIVELYEDYITKKDHYDYNQMKVLLIEGPGGNIAPYEAHLNRIGISGRPEVELFKLKQKSRLEVRQAISRINTGIVDNFDVTSKFSLVHCYLSAGEGQTRLDSQGRLEVLLCCGKWFAFEAKMRKFSCMNY